MPRSAEVLGQLNRLCAAEWSDAQLLRDFALQHSEKSFQILVDRHGPVVLRICRNILSDTYAAEDAFQATFLLLSRKAKTIAPRHPGALAAWLFAAARRIALKARTAEARRLRREAKAGHRESTNPLDELTARELGEVLDSELARMSEFFRLPLLLCFWHGLTQDEAARRLGVTPGAIKGRLERGRAKLAARLARRGVAPALLLTATGAIPTRELSAGTVELLRPESKVPVAVAALAGSVSTRPSRVAALAVVLLVALGGFGLRDAWLGATPKLDPPTEKSPATKAETPKVDYLGDPLPEGAIARLGTKRLEHGSSVRVVAFSPDGQTLLSSGFDGRLAFWDAATGKEKFTITTDRHRREGYDPVDDAGYSPDGTRIAAAPVNSEPCVMDASSGKVLFTLGDANTRANRIRFTVDGKHVVYERFNNNRDVEDLVVADSKSGREEKHIELHRAGVTFHWVGVGRRAGSIVMTCSDGSLRVLDALSGDEKQQINGSYKDSFAFAQSRDGKTIALGSVAAKTIHLLDAGTGKRLWSVLLKGKYDGIFKLAFSPNGQELYSGHKNGALRVWNCKTGRELRTVRESNGAVISISLSPDGKRLAYLNNDFSRCRVHLLDTTTLKPALPYAAHSGIHFVTVSRDGRIAATAGWEGSIRLWETATGKPLAVIDAFGPIAFTPNGKYLLWGGWDDCNVHIWEIASAKEVRQFQVHAGGVGRALAVTTDSAGVFAVGPDDNLKLWDLATGRELRGFDCDKKVPLRASISPDGKRVACTSMDSILRVWEIATGRLIWKQSTGGAIAFSPDGRLLAWSTGQRAICISNAETGTVIRRIEKRGDPMDTLAFSPDSMTLAWGGQDEALVYLFETATGQERRILRGHIGPIQRVVYANDGRLITAGTDGSALVWDPAMPLHADGAPIRRDAKELSGLWDTLGSEDAQSAWKAMTQFARSPDQFVELSRSRVLPVPKVDMQQVRRLLRDLGDNRFGKREQASRELAKLGEGAEPELRQFHKNAALEARRRVEHILGEWEQSRLRTSRVLELLEHLKTPAATEALKRLANGAPGTWLTIDAANGLKRVHALAAR